MSDNNAVTALPLIYKKSDRPVLSPLCQLKSKLTAASLPIYYCFPVHVLVLSAFVILKASKDDISIFGVSNVEIWANYGSYLMNIWEWRQTAIQIQIWTRPMCSYDLLFSWSRPIHYCHALMVASYGSPGLIGSYDIAKSQPEIECTIIL